MYTWKWKRMGREKRIEGEEKQRRIISLFLSFPFWLSSWHAFSSFYFSFGGGAAVKRISRLGASSTSAADRWGRSSKSAHPKQKLSLQFLFYLFFFVFFSFPTCSEVSQALLRPHRQLLMYLCVCVYWFSRCACIALVFVCESDLLNRWCDVVIFFFRLLFMLSHLFKLQK